MFKDFIVRMFYVAVAAGLILLGIVGLFFPVLPGVLFLFLGFLVLGRASSRVNQWLETQSWFRQIRFSWNRAALVSWSDRVRLTGLMMTRYLLSCVSALHQVCKTMLNRMAPTK